MKNLDVPEFAKGFRVLLVDHDVANLQYMSTNLRSYKVIKAETSHEALSMIMDRRRSIDIVIAEVDMPQSVGFHLLQQIRAHRKIPIILMAADFSSEKMSKALSLGACGFFQKPMEKEELVSIWNHVMQNRFELAANPNGKTDESNSQNSVNDIEEEYSEDVEGDIELQIRGPRGRVVWTPQLEGKFRTACALLGKTNAKPLEILKLMNVPNLKPHHISSHLQRYKRRFHKPSDKTKAPLPTPNVGNIGHGPFIPQGPLPTPNVGYIGHGPYIPQVTLPTPNVGNIGYVGNMGHGPYTPQVPQPTPNVGNIGHGPFVPQVPQQTPNAGNIGHVPSLWNNLGSQNIAGSNSFVRANDFGQAKFPTTLEAPYLSSSTSMGGQNTTYNAVLPTQGSTYKQYWDLPHLSSILGGGNNSSIDKYSGPGGLVSTMGAPNSNVTNSMILQSLNVPTREQLQNAWDLSTPSYNMGGQITNNNIQFGNVNFGQHGHQQLPSSYSLMNFPNSSSNYMGGQITNIPIGFRFPDYWKYNVGASYQPNNPGAEKSVPYLSLDFLKELETKSSKDGKNDQNAQEKMVNADDQEIGQESVPIGRRKFTASEKGKGVLISENDQQLDKEMQQVEEEDDDDDGFDALRVFLGVENGIMKNDHIMNMVQEGESSKINCPNNDQDLTGEKNMETKRMEESSGSKAAENDQEKKGDWDVDDVIKIFGEDKRFFEWLDLPSNDKNGLI